MLQSYAALQDYSRIISYFILTGNEKLKFLLGRCGVTRGRVVAEAPAVGVAKG